MKNLIYALFLLALTMTSCVADIEPDYNDEINEKATTRSVKADSVFYYYGYENRKIYLNQVKDEVFVKFKPTATKAQFQKVANTKSLNVKNKEDLFVEGPTLNTTMLEGNELSLEDLRSLKLAEGVASATYMLESQRGSRFAVTDEFIVKLKEESSFGELQNLAEAKHCTIGDEDEFVKNQYYLYVSAESELDAMQTANLFYETGMFEFSEPNMVIFNAFNSNDTYYDSQWPFTRFRADIDINIEPAWAITTGEPSIRIAVVDDGVELTHPDLINNLLPGYDATGKGTAGGTYYNNSYLNGEFEKDGDNHGTAVATIIAAEQNNGIGISGVAPNCKIVPVKVGQKKAVVGSWCASGINWIVNNNKAEVINCSWGFDTASTALRNAINNALQNGRGGKGCVIVAATGNSNSSYIPYPAALSGVISVGAVNMIGFRSIWESDDDAGSNYGAALDVVAPGSTIFIADRQGGNGYSPGYDHATVNGTSFAAPHVAGIAALVLSVYPNFTSEQVVNMIERSARKVGNYPYVITSGRTNGMWNNEMGYGLVDAASALCNNPSIHGPTMPIEDVVVQYSVQTPPAGVTVGWTINDNRYTLPGTSLPLSMINETTLSIILTTTSNYTLTAYYALPNGIILTGSKYISVYEPFYNHRPYFSYVKSNGDAFIPATVGETVIFTVKSSHPQASSYEWEINGVLATALTGKTIQIDFPSGGLAVRCRARGGGAVSGWSTLVRPWGPPEEIIQLDPLMVASAES